MTVQYPAVAAVGIDVRHHRAAGTASAETVRMVVTSLILRRRRNDGGIDHPRRRITTTGRISGTDRGNRNGISTTEGVIRLLPGGLQEVPVQLEVIAGDVRQPLQSQDLVRTTTTVLRRIEVGVGLARGIDREVPGGSHPTDGIRAEEVGHDHPRICRR